MPRPFSKKSKLSILDQQSKVLYSFFLLHAKFRAIEMNSNSAEAHLLLPYIIFIVPYSCKDFLKNKKR